MFLKGLLQHRKFAYIFSVVSNNGIKNHACKNQAKLIFGTFQGYRAYIFRV